VAGVTVGTPNFRVARIRLLQMQEPMCRSLQALAFAAIISIPPIRLRVTGQGMYVDIILTHLVRGQSQQEKVIRVVVKVARVVIAAKVTVNEVVKVLCLT